MNSYQIIIKDGCSYAIMFTPDLVIYKILKSQKRKLGNKRWTKKHRKKYWQKMNNPQKLLLDIYL